MNNKIFCVMLAAASYFLTGQYASAVQPQGVLQTPAVMTSRANNAVLQAITRAGDRLVAVGERGVVLLSDDSGKTWRQARVPVNTTLTAVEFSDASQGWAVGHAGVVLHTGDAGETWTIQLDGLKAAALELAAAASDSVNGGSERRLLAAQQLVEDGADKPFLALSFTDAKNGLVVGAYGLAFHTVDGGVTWQSWMGRIPNPKGLHLYGVSQQNKDIYLAGEQGLLLRSLDAGSHFDALDTPYEGSYFSVALLPTGRLLIGGLRGKLFTSDDQGNSFQASNNSIPVSFNTITVAGKRLLLVNQAGIAFQSGFSTISMDPLPLSSGHPLTALIEAADGTLVGVGLSGTLRLPSVAAASQSSAE